jgi:hypothetical protein
VGDVWRDTTVELAAPPTPTRYREALTNRPVVPTRRGGAPALALADLFDTLPLALIVEEPA